LNRGSKKLGIGRTATRISSRPPVLGLDGLRMVKDAVGQELWKLASVYLPYGSIPKNYPYRKVWREGVEVAMKIKGSQGKPRVEWVKVEHPFTAISLKTEVHANHLEALNSALRRRATAYRRRQNQYAKIVEGLQRALNVQRLLHNWVKQFTKIVEKQNLCSERLVGFHSINGKAISS
jgi:hypothetical protein